MMVWHGVTRHPPVFAGEQVVNGNPGIEVSQLGIRAWVNDSLGSSNVGIHKYGLNASSSQLGIKILGTRVSRADGHGFRSCIVVCCVFCA